MLRTWTLLLIQHSKIHKTKSQEYWNDDWDRETMELVVFRLDEAHRSKCALYDAKPPILASEQLSHNEYDTVVLYVVSVSVQRRPYAVAVHFGYECVFC